MVRGLLNRSQLRRKYGRHTAYLEHHNSMGQHSSSTVGVGRTVQVDRELQTDLRLWARSNALGIQGLNSGEVELTFHGSSDFMKVSG